jgi:hypothetical protein
MQVLMTNKNELKKYIPIQMRIAKKLHFTFIKKITISTRQNNKYAVELTNGKIIHYGRYLIKVEDYLMHKDDERRTRRGRDFIKDSKTMLGITIKIQDCFTVDGCCGKFFFNEEN